MPLETAQEAPPPSIVRVIDFETTGTEPPEAEVCEVGFSDVVSQGGDRLVAHYASRLCRVRAMPPEARAVHHISLAECSNEEPFNPADLLAAHYPIVAFAAHNAEFEAKFFTPPKPLLCTYKAALRVWPDAPGHSNSVLRYWLEDQGKIEPVHILTQPAHRAGPDAYTTAHILVALLDAGATLSQMIQWTAEPRVLPTCPIGKFRGQPWPAVELGFLQWMIRQPTMEEDLRWNAKREIQRRVQEGTSHA